jgi:hypothetical protein
MTGTVFMSSLLPPQPLLWWSSAQLDAVGGRVATAWSAWMRDWVRTPAAGEAEALPAHERPDREKASWVCLGTRGDAAAWIQVRTEPRAEAFEMLFAIEAILAGGGAAGQEGIGQAVATRAWAALADALCAALELAPGEGQSHPDGESFKPWSGCVVVSLAGAGRLPRTLLLNAACARALLGPLAAAPAMDASRKSAAALVPLAQALAGRKLPLRVELSSCELDLGTLEGLRIGDIVPLPHSLEAPLTVSTAQDVRICTGFLGRHAGFKAIELAREAPADREAPIDHHSQREV